MKIQIDTKQKTIKVEDSVKLKDLYEFLDKVLPKEWKDYTLETSTVINNFSYPVIVEKYVPQYPIYPNINNPSITWYAGSPENNKYLCNSGTDNIYNLEIN